MKRGSLLLIIFVVVLGLLVAAGVSILHDGLSARAKPSALEAWVARNARKMSAPAGAHSATNPIADSPQVQREARLHFADHCAICHGNDGTADTMIGIGLYPKPPDLRADETQKLSDGDIFWIIENGVRLTGMPAFGGPGAEHEHNAEDSWKLVRFIRHLPALTPEEKLEMEKNNPKSPEDRQEEQEENDFLKGGSAKPPEEKSKPHH